jgi:molecular chaperone HtpG
MTVSAEKMEFKTELKQLLYLITHSLYSNKEIFLRELISNAGDAINKIRYDSLDHQEILEGNKDWKIKIIINKELGTLTISDNGIGMSRETVIENLGTIARSGTKNFLERVKAQEGKTKPELIGQFGVGFYSAFMVADKVEVLSRMAGKPEDGICWVSDGQGEFTIESRAKNERGTDVILYLKPEEKDFLESYKLRSIIRKFSDFIEHPILLEVAGEAKKPEDKDEILNSQKALWLRGKSEVTQEEYDNFYKQISNDFQEPAKVIHYTAEGMNEFRVLLFIPQTLPMEFQFGEVKVGPRLYVQRVLIMDNCEQLLPPYLRFVKGVVDCADLHLNISREILQQNPVLERIRKDVVGSILKALKDMKKSEPEKYIKFFSEMGSILKEGLRMDFENREKVADLLLFNSWKTPADKNITLEEYVSSMPEGQSEIYYLAGETRAQLEYSPLLEVYKSKQQDVLLLLDPIDEFSLPYLQEYKGKKLKAVDRVDSTKADSESEILEATKSRYNAFVEYLKGKLDSLSDVKLTSRLKESPVVLVTESGGFSASQERFLRKIGRGQEGMESKRVMEINPEHTLVQKLRDLHEEKSDSPKLLEGVQTLYDLALLAEGSKVHDLGGFMKRVQEAVLKGL